MEEVGSPESETARVHPVELGRGMLCLHPRAYFQGPSSLSGHLQGWGRW